MATRVSMLGEPWRREEKPLEKNFRLMYMTSRARSIWVMAMETWFSRKAGTGKWAMLCPILKYISTSSKPRERSSRFFSTGVSWSWRVSSSACARLAADEAAAPLTLAP